jgi:hypothetical protein
MPISATPAQASAYRYWSYWSWNGSTWSFSNQGPSASVHDGQVIGWRFAVQTNSGDGHSPRAAGTSLCSDGVTVVIDYGTNGDEPPGEHPPYTSPRAFCANNPDSTTGYRATDEGATLRVRNDGLVCGIDGYPKTECAPIVTPSHAPTTSPKATTASQPPAVGARHTHGGVPTTTPGGAGQTAAPGASAAARSPQSGASAVTVPTPSPTPTLLVTAASTGKRNANGGGVPVGLIAALVAVAAVSGAAFWRYRAQPR